jgi:signal transduction histidine kinase
MDGVADKILENLTNARRQFEELFYAHPDAMMVISASGDVLFANRTAEHLLTGANDAFADQLDAAQAGDGGEIELRVNGGRYAGEMRVVGCDWDNAPARLAVIRDVTEQKRLSARYRKLKKMQLIGRFAGGLAHDFGNILGCVDVLAAVAQKDIERSSVSHERLRDIRAAAASGRAIVDQLLSLERSQRPTPQLSDPREILSRVEQIVRPVLPPEIDLHVSCASDAPSICVDASNLEQALFNLAFNAREAMPEGGLISIGCTVEDNVLIFSVSDTGHGVAPEHLPDVFELFHSTKPRGAGHGLGLAICQAITEQASGSIWVENRPGAGARFNIALPLSLARAS